MKHYSHTEEDIIKALMKLLEKKSLEKISMQNIADDAKVHRSTIYQYYEDKFQILQEVLVYLSQELVSTEEDEVDPIEVIVDFILEYHTIIYNSTYGNTKIQPMLYFEDVFYEVMLESMPFSNEKLPLEVVARCMATSFLSMIRMYHESVSSWSKQDLYDVILALRISLQQ